MTSDHNLQRNNCMKMIEHLEIAKAFCELMWTCAENIPDNSLFVGVEPHNIEGIIEEANNNLSHIYPPYCSNAETCF